MEYTIHELDQLRNRDREKAEVARVLRWSGPHDASPFIKAVAVSKCIRDAENEMYNERMKVKRRPEISRKTLP